MVYWRAIGGILGQRRPFDADLMVVQVGFIDEARNALVREMLAHPSGYTHLFFLDSDILLPPDALVRLLAGNLPIVSGLYRGRRPPHRPVAYVRAPRGGYVPIPVRGGARRRVDAVGAGCLLIRREVLESVAEPWFATRYRRQTFVSEDFTFCEKARAKGFEIHVDARVRCVHLEPAGVGFAPNGGVSVLPIQ